MNIKQNIIKLALKGLNIIKGLPLKLIKKGIKNVKVDKRPNTMG